MLIQSLTFMDTNKNIILLLSLFTASLFFQQCSCNKTLGLDCAQVKYSFELPVKGFPDKGSILIGDTIWLEINETTNFKNGQNGEMVDYSGASNLGSAIGFSYRDTVLKQWVDAVSRFKFSLQKGTELKVTPLDIQYRFSEENGRYIFKLGVIPKEKGLHSLLFSSSNNTYRNSDKCTKANFIINFKNTNQHYYLSPSYNGQTNLVGGDYYFIVK
jgi:hypothetical protein